MSCAYYNENDPHAAAWLRELIRRGLIADGEVDERSIEDVRPNELAGFRQCHFFAGIGGWAYALRLAGWGDDQAVWTGSCPCQPFSAAGRSGGFDDRRHLWPHWFRLIRECRPVAVFGEQVASADGLAWLDFVCSDMEAEGYAIGAVDTCAAGVGAPHIRQRLYWVADSECGIAEQYARTMAAPGYTPRQRAPSGLEGRGSVGELADSNGRDTSAEGIQRGWEYGQFAADGCACELADAMPTGRPEGWAVTRNGSATGLRESGFWSDAGWIACTDGKARPTKPGLFPLAHGIPGRVGILRGAGNAIVPQVAAAFIGAYLDIA